MSISRWIAVAALTLLLAGTASAASPHDAEEFDCPLPALTDGKLFLTLDGWIWLMDGEHQIASMQTTATLHPTNSVTCSETSSRLMSQGVGTMVVSFIDIDWATVLPASVSTDG